MNILAAQFLNLLMIRIAAREMFTAIKIAVHSQTSLDIELLMYNEVHVSTYDLHTAKLRLIRILSHIRAYYNIQGVLAQSKPERDNTSIII